MSDELLNQHPIIEFFKIPGEVRHIKKGEYLYREGENGDYFFVVMSGTIKVTKSAGNGRELTLRLAKRNSIVAELMLFTKNGTYLFSGYAAEDSTVYAITCSIMEQYLIENPTFTHGFMQVMSDHVRKQHTKFRDLILYGRKGALYSTLIRFCNSYGKVFEDGIIINTPLTHQDLANFSATSRESVNRILTQLKADGIIATKGKNIIVKDIEFLRKEINCEGCPEHACSIE